MSKNGRKYNWTFLAIAGVVSAVSVPWLIAFNSANLSSSEVTALKALNNARTIAGAPALRPDKRLTMASRWQAEHIKDTGEVAHIRVQNTGFLGIMKTPEDRRLVALYLDRGSESLTRSFTAEPQQTVTDLLNAPYHRVGLLDPAAYSVGVGLVPHTVNFVKTIDAGFTLGDYAKGFVKPLVVWPTPGAVDVPPFFLPGTETPNPSPGSKVVGYIVTIQVGTDETLKPRTFTLKNVRTGELIEGRVAYAETDSNLQAQAAAFIPSSPLGWDTEYKAEFKGQASFGAIDKSWTFRTAPKPAYALTVVTEGIPRGTVNFTLTSPLQPALVCSKASPAAKTKLSWVNPENFQVVVSDCGGNSCAVQVYLSDSAECKTKISKVNLLFGGKTLHSPPELLGHS